MADTINMPKLGFDMAEGTLIRWMKKIGEPINKGEVLAEIETDKATVEVESTVAGTVRVLLVDEGTIIPVNTPIAIIGLPDEKIELPIVDKVEKLRGDTSPVKTSVLQVSETKEKVSEPGIGIRASPLAKKIALEKNIDLSTIPGSGPGGRIVRRDIEAALQGKELRSEESRLTTSSSSIGQVLPSVDQVIQINKLRRAIGRRMTEAKSTIPHFYVTHEYMMDRLMDLRSQWNDIASTTGKISINDFIIKATALALTQFPNLNSSLEGDDVRIHAQVNIGVAASVEGGLLTVVCREADKKSLPQIAEEVRKMVGRARENKVKPEDIEGSTFSISNLGMFDVENFAAIINPPEAAILAIGSVRAGTVVHGDSIKPGLRMKATLSVDHRVSDGVEAAKFLQALAVYLEEPLRLVL